MKKMKHLLLAVILGLSGLTANAQQKATMLLNAQTQYQRITGFGGFVCSPQFTYNHMSNADIKKVWGEGSTVGCNIMRLYIPIGKNSWSQSLQTAKNAKQMGLIVFASPWGQPAEWKTNGTSNAKNSDGTTGKLKRENWPDYAQYLEDYVQYLRKNGVELDAISIQNEPDWPAEYAGCLWSASEIAEFVKTYGPTISCKVMAPETLGVSDSYVNALNKADVLPGFDIYGGHQYGGLQSAYKNLAAKGKELWMTEYLINWNEAENNTRNFDFSKDFFNFFQAINTCMLGNFNAWIHYAAKRYYAMLGDGQRGTSSGVVTKRGYVMAHFARFVTGMTRIQGTITGGPLQGSAYISQTGDTVVAVLANTSDEPVVLTADLPFYTQKGMLYTTTKNRNMSATMLTPDQETCRPQVTIEAQAVATMLFVRSRDRQPSNMTAAISRFDRLDDMSITRSTFTTAYKLSNKTKTFDHSNPLISSRTNASYGYVALNDRYNRLVMHVKRVTSTMNYTSSNTTLTYVNAKGEVATHNYGELDLNRRENFDLTFDLSPATLADGCMGLISLTNNNWSSTLTITFGDVYLGTNYAGTLKGIYVSDDSYVQQFSEDDACTSVDMTAVNELPLSLPWIERTNRVAYVPEQSPLTLTNIVSDNSCTQLSLRADGGDFRPMSSFNADVATLTIPTNGLRLVMVPFDASLPEGVRAYALGSDLTLIPVQQITAHQPVLIESGSGTVILSGCGTIGYSVSPLDALLRGTYTTAPLYPGDYVLTHNDQGERGFLRVATVGVLQPFDAYLQLPSSTADFLPLDLSQTGINAATAELIPAAAYNLHGQRVNSAAKGIIIVRGKKTVRR